MSEASGPRTWDVPESWAWSTMGEVAEVVGGGTPSTAKPEYFKGDIPWITPADLSGYGAKSIRRGARCITKTAVENSGARLMPAGTVLFSSRAPIGYVAIAANALCTNQGFKSFLLRSGIEPDYVYHYLHRAKPIAVGLASGTTFLEISGKNAARIPIPLPPLPEQRRIVEALETQFTRLDAAATSLERAQANLKRCREAVLQAVVEGRLGGVGSWPTTTLGEVLASPLCHGKSVPTRDDGFPVLRLTAIRRGTIDITERKGGDWTRDDARAFLVRPGDFLVARGNGSIRLVGRGGLAPEKCDEVAFPDTMIRVRVREDSLLPRFMRLVWDAPPVRRQIESMAKTTAGIHKINQRDMRSIFVPIPSLSDQTTTLVEAERQLSVIDATNSAVGIQLVHVARLRQSLLRLGFDGRLVAQNLHDEPASVLLDRIRHERAATLPSAKKKSLRSRR